MDEAVAVREHHADVGGEDGVQLEGDEAEGPRAWQLDEPARPFGMLNRIAHHFRGVGRGVVVRHEAPGAFSHLDHEPVAVICERPPAAVGELFS